ncbi:hypothetical protein BpHYR1_040667 [Brachionus plicatilis]|uniref:Uncharacterized protein n=1 Tax=Brachionus plicatilis TaxID=10195 RepID=A0A3M7RNG3_BRAPC|nr:hypothetical protein BpHYR1_040667 [Brachionus plicatilis]
MVSSRTCEGSKMSCENDDCIFDGTPKELFKWLRPVMSYGFVCTVKRVTLKSKSNLIFDTCDIKQLECKLKSSFVNWTKEIVNFCPYRLYMTIGLNLPFNNVFTDFVTIHDLILADSDGIELKTYTALDRLKEEICNIELSSLRTFRHHEDQFEILYAGNETLIVYVRDGIIFVPNCKTSYSVEVKNYNGCTRDPKVSFE